MNDRHKTTISAKAFAFYLTFCLGLGIVHSTIIPSANASVSSGVEALVAPDCDAIRAEIRKVKAQIRKAKKIKNTSRRRRVLKRLQKKLRNLKRKLAACLATPPFIEMVTVGNPGNPTDAGNSAEPNVYGSVDYVFKIGKYEVSLDQYTAFLNAVAATDAYGLYSPEMASNQNIAGIARSGDPGSYSYTVIGSGQHPVTFVSWFDAARFCNWLHNGMPSGLQDGNTTEAGAYVLNGATSGGLDISRESGAQYWIPAEDEWYKAAYHHPNTDGGPADHYYLYPTMNEDTPGNQLGPLPLVNNANFRLLPQGEFSVTQSATYSAMQNYLTDAGAYPGSPSFYGTFDQGGNVREWTDAVISATHRRVRGGSFNDFELDLRSSDVHNLSPTFESAFKGFRVASP